MKFTKPFIISVEGIISAGKTSIIEECLIPLWTSQGLRVRVIQEPVYKWNDILPIFYEDPKRWAYHFQTKAFLDRVEESKMMWEKYKDDTDIFILDRSIFSDPHFMKVNRDLGNVTEMEMRHYLEWWNMWKEVMPFIPHLFIYVTTTVEDSMIKLKKRNRPGECVSEEYQTLLKKYHDESFNKHYNIPHLRKNIRVMNIDSSLRNYTNSDENTKQEVANEILVYVKQIEGAICY
jgi:deoxyadenosine/deoxycytidine kinase